eukprot:gene588-1248_t
MEDDASAGNSNEGGIITLQCGHYSNFIGTHWWNIQNSSRQPLLPRPFFRDGVGKSDETCAPRLVCIDLKGSLKTLTEDGTLHHDETQQNITANNTNENNSSKYRGIPTPSHVSVHETESYKKNQFLYDVAELQSDSNSPTSLTDKLYNLDDVVDVWSDYLGTKYHPNSIMLLKQHIHDCSNFNSFDLGFSMNTDAKFWDSWEDRMHFFAEECDKLQGFQVLTDLNDGFGGLGVRIVENLRDLYGKNTIAVYGSWPSSMSQATNEHQQIINSALSLGHLVQESNLLALMSLQEKLFAKNKKVRNFQYLNYKGDSNYHTSAILASYLDSIAQHYTTRGSSLGEFSNNVTKTGHKIASTASALPLPTQSKSIAELITGLDCLYENDSLLQCLTPSQQTQGSIYSHQIAVRGLPVIFEPEVLTSRRSRAMPQANKEAFERYLFTRYSKSLTGMTFCEIPLATTSPYPQFFHKRVKANGFLQEPHATCKQKYVKSIPTLASLYTSSGMFDTLYDIIVSVRKLNKSRIVLTEQSGIEMEEVSDNLEMLNNVAEQYDKKRATESLWNNT